MFPDNREQFVLRTVAGWQFLRSGENTARLAGQRARQTLQWFALPPGAAGLRRSNPESVARFLACCEELRPVFPLFCVRPRRVRSPIARSTSRALLRTYFARSRHWFRGIGQGGLPPRHSLPWCSRQNTARGTFSFLNKCSRETWDRGGF